MENQYVADNVDIVVDCGGECVGNIAGCEIGLWEKTVATRYCCLCHSCVSGLDV